MATVITIQLPGSPGPAGPKGDPGPANALGMGTVTTSAPGSAGEATITGTYPNQVLNLTIPQGPAGATGAAGAAATLASGTITTGAPGTEASATITGTAPNYTLNLTIPRGDQGVAGPANSLSIGTVTTGPAAATITGTSPNQVLDLVIPQGPKGDTGAQGAQGIQGIQGPAGADGRGVPIGGLTGQLLGKLSNTDYDTTWLTAAVTADANTLMKRDASGRSVVAIPSALNEIANKEYVDVNAGSATATANSLARRDAAGALVVAAPTAGGHAVTKTYADALGTDANTPNTIVRRAASGSVQMERIYLAHTPSVANDVTRKDYVDSRDISFRRVWYDNSAIGAVGTGNYALALADEGVAISNGTATGSVTVVIPTNATVAFPVGSWVNVYRHAAHALTITPDTGVNVASLGRYGAISTPLPQYGMVRLHKIATDVWYVQQLSGVGGESTWIEPAYLNGWSTYNTDYAPARYRKLANGQVEVQGLVKGGTIGATTPVFFLPVGYRPNRRHLTVQMSNSAIGRVDFFQDGGVAVMQGNNAWATINHTFFADQ